MDPSNHEAKRRLTPPTTEQPRSPHPQLALIMAIPEVQESRFFYDGSVASAVQGAIGGLRHDARCARERFDAARLKIGALEGEVFVLQLRIARQTRRLRLLSALCIVTFLLFLVPLFLR